MKFKHWLHDEMWHLPCFAALIINRFGSLPCNNGAVLISLESSKKKTA